MRTIAALAAYFDTHLELADRNERWRPTPVANHHEETLAEEPTDDAPSTRRC